MQSTPDFLVDHRHRMLAEVHLKFRSQAELWRCLRKTLVSVHP